MSVPAIYERKQNTKKPIDKETVLNNLLTSSYESGEFEDAISIGSNLKTYLACMRSVLKQSRDSECK